MWDCLGYTVNSYVTFLRDFLIPTMRSDHPDLELLIFDHNPDAIYDWVSAAYKDSDVRAATWGAAVHWYSDERQRGIQANRTHSLANDKRILHTEACNCGGVTMPSDPAWWTRGEKYGVGLLQYLQVGLVVCVPCVSLHESDSWWPVHGFYTNTHTHTHTHTHKLS